MDPYKYISGAEGCSSSESGWTMYLASPMQEDEDDEGSYDGGNNSEAHMARYKNHYAAVEDEVSDDSMASDASSGPHHRNNHENGHGTVNFKHSKGGHFNLQSSSAKKPGKKEKKSDKNSAIKSRKLDSHRKHK
ncbi:pheromone-processing carboxypeptidase KEX [Salix suchowensis]|nr:pheromone-processing carboxypeptidase KEX [Salix suchowensis]